MTMMMTTTMATLAWPLLACLVLYLGLGTFCCRVRLTHLPSNSKLECIAPESEEAG